MSLFDESDDDDIVDTLLGTLVELCKDTATCTLDIDMLRALIEKSKVIVAENRIVYFYICDRKLHVKPFIFYGPDRKKA